MDSNNISLWARERVLQNVATLVQKYQQQEDLWCELCKKGDREDVLLICDQCNRGFHIFCLVPPLPAVPKGGWTCNSCFDLQGDIDSSDDEFGSEEEDEEDEGEEEEDNFSFDLTDVVLVKQKLNELKRENKRLRKELKTADKSTQSGPFDHVFKEPLSQGIIHCPCGKLAAHLMLSMEDAAPSPKQVPTWPGQSDWLCEECSDERLFDVYTLQAAALRAFDDTLEVPEMGERKELTWSPLQKKKRRTGNQKFKFGPRADLLLAYALERQGAITNIKDDWDSVAKEFFPVAGSVLHMRYKNCVNKTKKADNPLVMLENRRLRPRKKYKTKKKEKNGSATTNRKRKKEKEEEEEEEDDDEGE